MDAKSLYQELDTYFSIDNYQEKDWTAMMDTMKPYLVDRFKDIQNGLVIDNAGSIESIFTATFASNSVISTILDREVTDALLITHHPMNWVVHGEAEDRIPEFEEISKEFLEEMKENNISLYSLHVPLDRNSPLSTAVSLATSVGGVWLHDYDFFNYYGSNVGVVTKLPFTTQDELIDHLESSFGHQVRLYANGGQEINKSQVGFVGGGGFKVHALKQLVDLGVNTFVTGITMQTPYNQEAHQFAEKNSINIIGGTHYSTEKQAMMVVADWIKDQYGLTSSFIPEQPDLGDIDLL